MCLFGYPNDMKIYHVITNQSSAEIEVIKEIQPPRLLVSYFYFKNKPLKDFIKLIGYKPEIVLDSGAYSAWTKGKNISPIDYMNYINSNRECTHYISLDVIGDPDLTIKYYEIMKLKGFDPIPVFHYGDNQSYLRHYISQGKDHIALGNTVLKNKKKVAEWINKLIAKYPSIKFHLLGSSSKEITENTAIHSCDSSTWFLCAINGIPKHIKGSSREAKIERAKYNLRAELGAVQAELGPEQIKNPLI